MKEPGTSAKALSLDEQASSCLQKNGAMSVPQLYDALRVNNPLLTRDEVTDLIWRLVEGGKADVEENPPTARSLSQYLRIWESNLWFYIIVVITTITVLAVYAIPSQSPLVVLRWILGSVFVLVIPGYVIVEALFPKGRQLDGPERFVLSVGMSLVLVMMDGLLLNYTPWGIRLTPIVISLTILTVGLSLAALERKFRLCVQEDTGRGGETEPSLQAGRGGNIQVEKES
jgi:hypothetical protein